VAKPVHVIVTPVVVVAAFRLTLVVAHVKGAGAVVVRFGLVIS
jgi:hypothetical protein